MSNKLIPFDVASFLETDEAIGEYLTQVLSDGDSEEFVRAIGYVAKARGMSNVAQATGLGRASLYKALSPGAKPRFDTVVKVMHALGVELRASATGRGNV
jgi:probable addiction module antidote protein